MLNRYQGNSGRMVRVEETPPSRPMPEHEIERPARPSPPQNPHRMQQGSASPLAGALGGIGEKLTKLIPTDLGQLETEDIILLLILYLMYRESGDSELLIIMGAMFLL